MKALKLSIAIFVAMMVMVLVLPAQTQEQDKEKSEQNSERMAKDRQEMGEKIKASKIAFITENVDLTPEEAEKFWPVYNEYEKKREEATHSLMGRFKGHKDGNWDDFSDEEAESMMEDRFKQEEALLELKKEYHKKFLDILSARKVMKLYKTEDMFKRQLMERLGQHERGRKADNKGTAPPCRERQMRR